MNEQVSFLRRLWAHDKTLDSLKVAIALGGVVAVGLWLDLGHGMISLILGVIASALAETEDRVIGRLKALCLTLACFACAAFSVQLLFPYPWLFVIGLTLSSFGFVMLGAAGQRYATIAIASLILAIYTMLAADQPLVAGESVWHQPVLLLCGAAWYGAISMLAAAIFATRATRQSLAHLFQALTQYLFLKADVLEPVAGRDESAQRLALAETNSRVVAALNKTREVLIRWVQDNRPSPAGTQHLKLYFFAQDVHERASSSHYAYAALAEAFARSDVLFRVHRVMRLQALACKRLAASTLRNMPFRYGQGPHSTLDEMAAALAYVHAHSEATRAPLVESLADLCRNIITIERLIANADNQDGLQSEGNTEDNTLRDSDPRNLRESWQRIRIEFTPKSARFRHGLRLALTLATGYGLLHLFNLPHGYWVLLTTVFVCQPSYSDTWRRMGQRVGGTVIGLLAASLFIVIFPQPLAQLGLAVLAGVAFFALRADRYLIATACMTVLVLACFNQFGSGYALILPRLFDTILGAALSCAAVALILPDWQGRRAHLLMAHTLQRSASYLAEILKQYREGKHDDLPYRIARRDAHNADAELSAALAGMLREPERHRLAPDLAFRFLCASNTLLAYISALGAHREQVSTWQYAELVTAVTQHIQKQLAELSDSLQQRSSPEPATLGAALRAQIGSAQAGVNPAERRVIRQLALINGLLRELHSLAQALAEVPTSNLSNL